MRISVWTAESFLADGDELSAVCAQVYLPCMRSEARRPRSKAAG